MYYAKGSAIVRLAVVVTDHTVFLTIFRIKVAEMWLHVNKSWVWIHARLAVSEHTVQDKRLQRKYPRPDGMTQGMTRRLQLMMSGTVLHTSGELSGYID